MSEQSRWGRGSIFGGRFKREDRDEIDNALVEDLSVSWCSGAGSGAERWYNSAGQLHRLDGPAIVRPDGSTEWHEYGVAHRVGGPAITFPNGGKHYYQGGKRHRTDGPAIENADGTGEWWIDGQMIPNPEEVHGYNQKHLQPDGSILMNEIAVSPADMVMRYGRDTLSSHMTTDPHDGQIDIIQTMRRHRNPDGSAGGWVSDKARVDVTATIGPNALVCDEAVVSGCATVTGLSRVAGSARVSGRAVVSGSARIEGHATVSEDAYIGGRTHVYEEAEIGGDAVVVGDMVFYGQYKETVIDAGYYKYARDHSPVGSRLVLSTDTPGRE